MTTENNIKFKNYLKIINSYKYLLFGIYLSFFVIFYLLGNFRVNHGLNISFSIKSTQTDRVFNNLVYLENTFETNFNEDEIIPMKGVLNKERYYFSTTELSSIFQDLTKKEVFKNFSNINILNKIGYNVEVQNEKIIMNFVSDEKKLIDEIDRIDFYANIINLIINEFQIVLNQDIEVIRKLSSLERNRIEKKLFKKNQQYERLVQIDSEEFLQTIFLLQNEIIDLEDQSINTNNRLNLCEGLFITINNDLQKINYLRNYTQSIKTFYNDLILNAFLYFIFATILFLFLIFILIIVKEE